MPGLGQGLTQIANPDFIGIKYFKIVICEYRQKPARRLAGGSAF